MRNREFKPGDYVKHYLNDEEPEWLGIGRLICLAKPSGVYGLVRTWNVDWNDIGLSVCGEVYLRHVSPLELLAIQAK